MTDELFPPSEPERHTLVTPDGTPLDIATSALIKSLRRGREVEALYFARQIEARFPMYVWRRLAIFAAEDVGLAEPSAITTITSLRTAYDWIKNESRGKPDPVLVAFAVLFLCRCAKNREADDLKNVVAHLIEEEGWRAPIPPAAIDLHTSEGRDASSLDEQLRAWFEEGSYVKGDVGPLDWRLAHRRWGARHGYLDSEQVEAEAVQLEATGRLRYGADGYRPGAC